jgi:hypothetical protein
MRLSTIVFVAVLAAGGWPGRAGAELAEPLYAVDHPTAGLLRNGQYHFQGRLGPASSFLGGLRLGFRDVLQIGVSFGMQNVFERGDVELNDHIGFRLRLRLLEEAETPAVAAGFDSQGQGYYHEQLERYDRKSPGFYLVFSRNYLLAVGFLSLHGGVNYSLERRDDDDPDLFLTAEWSPVEAFSIVLDTDAALNDNTEGDGFGGGGIYVDVGLRLSYGDKLSMMLIFRDVTENFEGTSGVGREFELAFVDAF